MPNKYFKKALVELHKGLDESTAYLFEPILGLSKAREDNLIRERTVRVESFALAIAEVVKQTRRSTLARS